jgi:hypothetical protein
MTVRDADYETVVVGSGLGGDVVAEVGDGIKTLSLRRTVDTGGLDTLTTEDRTEAAEWVRDGRFRVSVAPERSSSFAFWETRALYSHGW